MAVDVRLPITCALQAPDMHEQLVFEFAASHPYDQKQACRLWRHAIDGGSA